MTENGAPGRVQILLAAFRSARWLREQLDSILVQDHPDFELLIRDGGSDDGTAEIIREYAEKHPDRIVFAGSSRADAAENFSALLSLADADYLMFSDHDDIWFPDKITRTLRACREEEARCGTGTPVLVFTDSAVADEEGNEIHSSLIRYQKLDPVHRDLRHLILQNAASGNTMLFNRALLNRARPIPPEAVMHDHWITLCAAAFGNIIYVDSPTLLYRQHGDNVYGAFRYGLRPFFRKLSAGRAKITERFLQNTRQAAAFGDRYRDRLRKEEIEMLSALRDFDRKGFWEKRKILLRFGLRKSGFLRNAAMFFLI